jgi:FkbM family methyltransferase
MKQIAIYGAGAFGKIFYRLLGDQVSFFIDDFSSQDRYMDVPILKLQDIQKDMKIYISVMQHSKEIEQRLKKEGYKYIVSFNESIKFIPDILEEISKVNYLWLVNDRKKMVNREKLKIVRSLLKEKKSREIFDQIIKLRESLDMRYYVDPDGMEYFPQDLSFLDNLERINFIDCGAYTGDTIENLMSFVKADRVNMTVSFEPDKNNLLKLNQTLSKLSQKYKNINFLIYPTGVYSKNEILRFANSGVSSSASLNKESDIEVPVVKLDDTLFAANPNFIKMDIEGAEYEALTGAKNILQKYKPNLAICLYHKPQDLWELPLLIHKIEPSYEMYLRVHEDLCLSTVLYCISKEVSYV